jgi:hypothetical protein
VLDEHPNSEKWEIFIKVTIPVGHLKMALCGCVCGKVKSCGSQGDFYRIHRRLGELLSTYVRVKKVQGEQEELGHGEGRGEETQKLLFRTTNFRDLIR